MNWRRWARRVWPYGLGVGLSMPATIYINGWEASFIAGGMLLCLLLLGDLVMVEARR